MRKINYELEESCQDWTKEDICEYEEFLKYPEKFYTWEEMYQRDKERKNKELEQFKKFVKDGSLIVIDKYDAVTLCSDGKYYSGPPGEGVRGLTKEEALELKKEVNIKQKKQIKFLKKSKEMIIKGLKKKYNSEYINKYLKEFNKE